MTNDPTTPNKEPLIGLPTLMRMALAGEDLKSLGMHLLERAQKDPGDANALMDLSTVVQLSGDPETARNLQAEALKIRQLYCLPAAGKPASLRLLAIMGPGDLNANTPLEFLVEGSDVSLEMLYVTAELPFPARVPAHDVLFVATGESDANQSLLERIGTDLQGWPKPVLNRPERIVRLSRDGVWDLLHSAPGVAIPVSARIDREALERLGRGERSPAELLDGGDFPLIVRPTGSHAGKGLARLDDAGAVADYLATVAEESFYLSPFVDYRGGDGLFRKYRVALIDGRPFAVHMAISENWMIHYLNAGMRESAKKRAEEERFMAEFDDDFARRHAAALRTINERFGLDYLAIDCAETAAGDLLIFEVDSSMVVHAMDPVELFPYKQPQMRKVFHAFRELLAKAVASRRITERNAGR